MAHDTKGPQFEREVLKTLNGMGIECYGEHEQIPLSRLYPEMPPDEHFEIDIVALIGNICILIEVTIQQERNRDKIRRFIQHCNLIKNYEGNQRDLFSHFSGIPKNKLYNFMGITDWRYLYVGTSSELIRKDITARRFAGTNQLHIFNEENWEYFKMLEHTIKEAAQYELFAAIDINPSDIGDSSLGGVVLTKPCLELTNKTLFSGQNQVLANLFVVTFTPNELLRIARVLRFQGQPMAISSETSSTTQSGGYQRILIPDKLKNIRKFVNDDPKVAFPTNLTIVLSNECEKRDHELHIPSKYASIDIIDGQHRLFSYALASERVRNEARLIATAIKFNTSNTQEINQYAASTFITINSEQTRVKRDLIYLISYDVLDHKTPESIAAKIFKVCDSKPNGVLTGIFALSAFIKKNKFGETPIAITLIIKELSRISKMDRLEAINVILGNQEVNFSNSDVLIQIGAQLLEKYFSQVKTVFSGDWGNSTSLIMSAKYIGGFIRLLDTFVKEKLTVNQMYQELEAIKYNILQKYSEGRTNGQDIVFTAAAFHSYSDEEGVEVSEPLLSKKEGSIEKIHKLLNENRQSNFQSE